MRGAGRRWARRGRQRVGRGMQVQGLRRRTQQGERDPVRARHLPHALARDACGGEDGRRGVGRSAASDVAATGPKMVMGIENAASCVSRLIGTWRSARNMVCVTGKSQRRCGESPGAPGRESAPLTSIVCPNRCPSGRPQVRMPLKRDLFTSVLGFLPSDSTSCGGGRCERCPGRQQGAQLAVAPRRRPRRALQRQIRTILRPPDRGRCQRSRTALQRPQLRTTGDRSA